MKTKLLFIFIFSSLLNWGQEQNLNRYGLRLGADISKLIRSSIDKNYFGLELVADYRWNYNYYLAGQIGKENKTTQSDYFNYSTNGQYLKIGIDYNTYDNWYGMENMIYIGGRYGFSIFNQHLNSYQIHNRNRYWQENLYGTSADILRGYNGRTAHWIEFVLGIKVELLKNIYAGVSISLSKIILQTSGDFPNFWIPGISRVWEGSSLGINYNYTLTYSIPFYKKKKENNKNQLNNINSNK